MGNFFEREHGKWLLQNVRMVNGLWSKEKPNEEATVVL
jgi:hypothetical protein